MRRNRVFLLSIIFISALLSPGFVSAHIVKRDHTIDAVLHINPADTPIAGEESSIFFEIKDKENKFTAGECFCTFSVLRDGNTIGTQSLFQNIADLQSNNAGTVFTFPEKGVYMVRFTGKPKTDGAFQAFKLDYTVRVDKNAGKSSPQSELWNNWWVKYTPIIFIIIVVIAYISKAGLKKRDTQKTKESETS